MTTPNHERICTTVEFAINHAILDLDAPEKYQVAYDPDSLANLSCANRTANGRDSVKHAIQLYIETLFAERDVDPHTLRRWSDARRLEAKLFLPALTMTEGGALSRGATSAWWPLTFTAADVEWIDLHLARLRQQFASAEINEGEFDDQCRKLFAAPPGT